MDEDTLTLVRQLCTRIGTIMEDSSVDALLWDEAEASGIRTRLHRLERAGKDIETLAVAARILLAKQD